MRLLWVNFLASVSPVLAFINDSLPMPGAFTAGALQPATSAGWDNEADPEDFPDMLLDDKTWEDFQCKGDNLIKAMHLSNFEAAKLFHPPRQTAESPWEDFGALASWGWRQSTDPDDTFQNFLTEDVEHNGVEWAGLGLDSPLKELGLHNQAGDDPNKNIQIFYILHVDPDGVPTDGQTYNVGSKTYRATGAHYKFGIEMSMGAMFSLLLLSPVEAAKDRSPQIQKEGLPDLQRASDIAWLSWAKYAETKNKLKYFFNVAITNKETQQAIRRALKTTNAAYSPWPGVTFNTDTDEGKVLLGSPNGRGHGYFLAQHKAALGGNMYISKIQVFHGETEPFIPNMVLHVEQPKLPTEGPTKRRVLRRDRAKI